MRDNGEQLTAAAVGCSDQTEEWIQIKAGTKLLGTAVAAASLALGTSAAHAAPQASGVAKVPYASGGNVVAEATLQGPNPVGTRLCVYLNQQHPFTPDIAIASKCQSITGGTVRVSAPRPTCGNMTTWAVATYNGRSVWEGSTPYKLFC